MVYLGTVFWASVLCLTGKYGDLLDFVVIIVLIFIYDFRDIYSSKKMPDAERPYRALVIRFTCILHSCCYCICILAVYPVQAVGVVIMLLGIRFII
jgi:APA family basic amino acid/polyamine antiporter